MCRIGEGSLIGSNVDLLSGRHQHGSGGRRSESKNVEAAFISVRIGKNVWIGNRTVVMADVGTNSIIGAGSVVVKPISPDSLAVGNPAVVKNKAFAK